MRTVRLGCAAALLLLVGGTFVAAQEFRATISGRVTDPGNLPVPGVVVTATNTQTNEIATATTNDTGSYTIPFLKPGTYTVNAELSGFRKHTQEKVELQVGTTVTLNVQLQLGALEEIVTVVSESVEATKADRGLVVDNTRVTELPLNARNPFMLSYLAPGITYNGPAIYQRPFDNGAIADWSINGGQNRNNEFLLDGAPNNAVQGGNNIAYVPPVESVQEFKIVTNSYDAQYGRTAGGVINVSLKSGTNTMHGSVYEFARRKAFDSNEYLFELNNREKPNHELDQYGFQLDGPVRIPGLYNGKDRTFFMFQYEGYNELTPNPASRTFPTPEQIRGDFSNLRDAQGNLIVIYDPATGRQVGNQWVRDPFPGNVILPNRINPIAQKLLGYFPLPNTQSSGDPWRDNFLDAPNLAKDDYFNIASKVDQTISGKSRMFFSYNQNKRTETRYTNGITSGPAQDGQLPLQRLNYRGVTDWVRTSSNTLVLNIRTSLNQYIELARSDPGLGFDATELGFPAGLINQLPNKAFPRIALTDYTGLGRQGFNRETTTVWGLQPNFSWVKGEHNVRGGLDMRMTWYSRESNGNLFRLDFDRRYTQRVFNQGEALAGNSVASFLLGASHAGAIDSNFFPEFRWNYWAPWVQDDWKITNRLTVNLGLRWDINSPVFEEQNRLNYGFNTDTVNPVTSQIDASRFASYLPVRGGVEFVGVDGNPKYPYKWDMNNIQLRAGFAYMLSDVTIVRGGYGKYFLNVTGTTTQNGFSISTPLIGSLDGDRTPVYTLSNPFPTGVAQPPGADGGLLTFLGRSPNFSNPDYDNPYVHQFSIGVQRMLPWRTTVEASYVGSRTKAEQNSWGGFNDTPLELRNRCDPTQGGTVAFCNELLPNPFFGVPGFEGTSRFTSPTLSRSELSRPFPQFGGITMFERNDGRIWYNSAQFVVSKRASGGLTLNGTYTLSKMIEENGFRDDTAKVLQKSPYTTDRRHRITVSGVYDLPFGRGRTFGSNMPRVLDAIVGGWEAAGMLLYNSGRPWDLPGNVFYLKDAKLPVERTATAIRAVRNCVAQMSNTGVVTMLAFSTAAGCTEPNFIIRPSFTGRTTEFRSDDIRRPSFAQFDMNFAKMTRINDRLRVQIRLEVFNLLDWAMYDERQYENNPNNANFGTINRLTVRQSNFPRYGQLGVKLLF